MKSIRHEEIHTHDERERMLREMKVASDAFYGMATKIGNHAFIEFTGFMNEYIGMCERAHAAGVDFTATNVHAGAPLASLRDYEAGYIGEKFGCIFQSSFGEEPKLIDAFARAAFGVSVKVQAHAASRQ